MDAQDRISHIRNKIKDLLIEVDLLENELLSEPSVSAAESDFNVSGLMQEIAGHRKRSKHHGGVHEKEQSGGRGGEGKEGSV